MDLLAISLGELQPDEPLWGGLRAATAAGATGVEYWHPVRNGSGTGSADRDLAAIKSSGLSIACIATPTQLGTDARHESDAQILHEAIALAARHGVALVNTYFGYPADADDRVRIARYRERVLPVLELAERTGVTLVLENEFDCFGSDGVRADLTRRPAALRELVAAIDSPHFGLTFDACNALFAHLQPLQDFLRPLVDSIRYVHVKDGRRRSGPARAGWRSLQDSGQDFETCPLGEGEVGWPSLLAALAEQGYCGWYTSEPHAAPATRDEAWQELAVRFSSCAGTKAEPVVDGPARSQPTVHRQNARIDRPA